MRLKKLMIESKYNNQSDKQLYCKENERSEMQNSMGIRATKGTRVISFTSGKGGVGKTNTVLNVAISLARQGQRVLVLDADLGLANIDILLGLQPKFTLEDLFKGRRKLADIILSGPEGIALIPAANGVESICNLNAEKRVQLMEAIEEVGSNFDYLLIDTSAGIDSDVMYFNSASAEVVLVINSEPTSLTDAYSVIKLLVNKYAEKNFSVVANNVADQKEGKKAFMKLAATVDRFLQVRLNYLGCIPTDRSINLAVMQQRALQEVFPSSPASIAINQIAQKIDQSFLDYKVKGGMQFFFRQLMEVSLGN